MPYSATSRRAVRGCLLGLIACVIAAAIALSCNASSAYAAEQDASSDAPSAVHAMASGKAKWYKMTNSKGSLTIGKTFFKSKAKIAYASSANKVVTSTNYLKRGSHKFNLAPTVKFCGSSWTNFTKISRTELLNKLKPLKGYSGWSICAKVKNGKVVEVRLGA